nr:MAG TPA: hypothetical protein [Caudoviricetes sp.]
MVPENIGSRNRLNFEPVRYSAENSAQLCAQ